MEGREYVVPEALAEALYEFGGVASLHGHFTGIDVLPGSDDICKVLGISVEIGDHKGFDENIVETGVDKVALALWPELHIHLEMTEQPRDFIVRPLNALRARFAETVRIFLVGNVYPPARLAIRKSSFRSMSG